MMLFNTIPKYIHGQLFKRFSGYGHQVEIGDRNWDRFLTRHTGGATGIDDAAYDFTNIKGSFTLSLEVAAFCIINKASVKFHFVMHGIGNATYPRAPSVTPVFLFLHEHDAVQFKLRFL